MIGCNWETKSRNAYSDLSIYYVRILNLSFEWHLRIGCIYSQLVTSLTTFLCKRPTKRYGVAVVIHTDNTI